MRLDAPDQPKERKPRRKRAAFPVLDEAALDAVTFAVVDEKSIEAKKELAKATAEIPQIFTPDQVEFLFDAYAVALSFLFSVILKCEYKIIHDELKFEPEMKATLAKPLARIASKYAPVSWAGLGPEIELITAMGMYTATSFNRAKFALKLHKEKLAADADKQPEKSQAQAA